MMQSLHALVQENHASETPLAKFRRTLAEDEQVALDKMLHALHAYEVRAAQSSQVLPFESLLLMVMTQQNERVERLEILLQRLAERVVELYLGEGKVSPKLKVESSKWESEENGTLTE